MYDLVIRGGRVIDPETGFDAIADLAISAGRIAEIGPDLGPALREIDAAGLIVAPGFIDLHGHGQSLPADRMQAFDGVTTSLELEVGAMPVAEWYAAQQNSRRLLNYGTAASWIFARKAVMIGLNLTGGEQAITTMGRGSEDLRWSFDAATAAQAAQIVDMLREGIDAGALGIGIPYAYAPGAGGKEMSLVCDLAAEKDVATYTHVANMSNVDPRSSVEAYLSLIGLSAATGAHMHICHLNSTSLQDIERSVELIAKAQSQGLRVTTEAYPYGTGSTVISASFLNDPKLTERTGTTLKDVEIVAEQRRLVDRADLDTRRSKDPAQLVLWHFLDTEENPEHQRMLDLSVLMPGGVIGSDAMPWTNADGSIYEGDEWPLGADKTSHPRSSGTFTRFVRQYQRERGAISLHEALARCTVMPAKIIESAAPIFARKGRLQEGCDADVVVFDYENLTERATFRQMNLPATGMKHVLVGGTAVIDGGALVLDAAPGRPIKRGDQ